MGSKTNVLMTGVTGYIGGSVLRRFLDLPQATSDFNITVLVRDTGKAEKLNSFGVNAVVGSHSDYPLMEKLASEADVVLAMADADNLQAAQATLKGLKKRYTEIGSPPILIHTSGTGVLTDSAAGMYQYETIYDDADPEQIESLAPTQAHRNVDLEIVNADKEGYVKTYIILPSMIYGIATGQLVEQGIQNPHSVQIPWLIKSSIDRGQAGMVGLGKNLWPNVHVEDIADLYITVFDFARSNPLTGHGREGFYFGENGETSYLNVVNAIGQAMVELGISKSAEPTSYTKEEMDKYFGGSDLLGTNSRCRANRSRAIGWKPTRTTADMLASLKPEAEALLKKRSIQL
ncbi:NAD(P)-binding protein [Tricholoma matsutake]|nr:NAD(P)-binding protein [Tricholoma matsutake 945]